MANYPLPDWTKTNLTFSKNHQLSPLATCKQIMVPYLCRFWLWLCNIEKNKLACFKVMQFDYVLKYLLCGNIFYGNITFLFKYWIISAYKKCTYFMSATQRWFRIIVSCDSSSIFDPCHSILLQMYLKTADPKCWIQTSWYKESPLLNIWLPLFVCQDSVSKVKVRSVEKCPLTHPGKLSLHYILLYTFFR